MPPLVVLLLALVALTPHLDGGSEAGWSYFVAGAFAAVFCVYAVVVVPVVVVVDVVVVAAAVVVVAVVDVVVAAAVFAVAAIVGVVVVVVVVVAVVLVPAAAAAGDDVDDDDLQPVALLVCLPRMTSQKNHCCCCCCHRRQQRRHLKFVGHRRSQSQCQTQILFLCSQAVQVMLLADQSYHCCDQIPGVELLALPPAAASGFINAGRANMHTLTTTSHVQVPRK